MPLAKPCLPLLTLALLAPTLRAQTAPATPPVDGRAIELSPFSVTATKDQGYLAASTLAGSRLNTSLLDTPASISVMTAEFIADIAATNVNDALAFALNAERDTSDATGNPNSSGDLPLSIRGFGGSSLGRNYFQWGLESDTYNTERIDLSRGPNSILFGTGGPGGIINTTTKRALFGRDVTQLGLRVGSWEDYRGMIDLSRQLGKTFAARLNLVKHEQKNWRDFVSSDRQGVALAATWRPFKNTEIRFDGEYGDVQRVLGFTYLPGDIVSPWVNGGRQISTTFGTPVTGAARTTARPLIYEASTNTAQSWFGSVNTSSAGLAVSTPRNRALTNFSIFPLSGSITGTGNINHTDFYGTGLFVEQRIGNLWLEAAASRQSANRLWVSSYDHADIGVRADANAFLPDGRPNPNAGQLYIEGNAAQNSNDRVTDDLRATAAWTLDLNNRSPWLGSYSLTGLVSRRVSREDNDNLFEVNTTPVGDALYPRNFTNANNRLQRRAYLTGPNSTGGGYDARTRPVVALNGVTSGFGRAQNQGVVSREELDSQMIAAQAKILKDRLVLTAGFRRDQQKNFDGTATADAITGLFSRQTLNATSTDYKGATKTFGAVVHLTKWAAAFYNKSDNFVPQSTLTILGSQLGPRFGDGEDYGLKFRLFDGKVYAVATRYATSEVNRLNFASGVLINIINEIYEATSSATRVSGPTSRDGVDTEGQGYEFELTANPTPQWRFTANFAQTEGTQSNNQPRLRAYVAERRAGWATQPNLPLLAPIQSIPATDPLTGQPSNVATAIRALDNEVNIILGANGVTRRQLREYTGSLFTAYTFKTDNRWLNDLTTGLGVRYRGKPVVGYRNGTTPVFGASDTLMNLMLAKSLRLLNRRVRLQANIDNVLDRDDLIVADADDAGIYRYLYPSPRRWTLSATVNF